MPADEHNEVVHDNARSADIIHCAVGRFRGCLLDYHSSTNTMMWRQDYTSTSQRRDNRRWGYDVGCLDAQGVFMARVEDVIKEVQKQSRALVISEFEDVAGESTLLGTPNQTIDKEEAPIEKSARHVMIAMSAVIFLWVVFLW